MQDTISANTAGKNAKNLQKFEWKSLIKCCIEIEYKIADTSHGIQTLDTITM
jgi:hypothetical protein